MKLYDLELSGSCYRVRLLLSLLEMDYQKVTVDLMNGEHKQETFLAINPKGQVPVLEDGDNIVSDSHAILVYLASKYNNQNLYPQDTLAQSRIAYWISTAENEIRRGLIAARLVKLFKFPLDYEEAERHSYSFLNFLEQHLRVRPWLEFDHLTLADIIVFPYVALAEDGEISLQNYPKICEWIKQIKSLPRYIDLPGDS